ncbi:hypothetical protein LMG27174_05147 [Paraburkholderia rhynchosiae]|uniref:Uncharacterized protein n=1 Tax=Paraburkholderia rhynchosiae TaxID=487049 RepID=A0A6J5C0A4_9BURK|nr:hypothetical protein LMG27174_05147 [Paraburkholderia rhynchosiae]
MFINVPNLVCEIDLLAPSITGDRYTVGQATYK